MVSSYHGGPVQILDSPCKICGALNGKCLVSFVLPLMHHNNMRCGIALTGLTKAYIFLDMMPCLFRRSLLPPSWRLLLACAGDVWATLKMGAVISSDTLECIHQTTWSPIPEDGTWPLKCLNHFFLLNLWAISRLERSVKNTASLKTAIGTVAWESFVTGQTVETVWQFVKYV
jgi:hypothetical protein